jgi:6,7-dimethyl-8-ribityllumazine synthase
MADLEGRLEATGSVAIVVARYHGRLTRRLLEGATAACIEAGHPAESLTVCWVDGAFELGVASMACARSGRYSAIVALGVVVRGETPHFDFVAGEAAAALGRVATETLVPVGLGLLTCDTIEQAIARAGGEAGNKGREAAEAALRTASLLRLLADG